MKKPMLWLRVGRKSPPSEELVQGPGGMRAVSVSGSRCLKARVKEEADKVGRGPEAWLRWRRWLWHG